MLMNLGVPAQCFVKSRWMTVLLEYLDLIVLSTRSLLHITFSIHSVMMLCKCVYWLCNYAKTKVTYSIMIKYESKNVFNTNLPLHIVWQPLQVIVHKIQLKLTRESFAVSIPLINRTRPSNSEKERLKWIKWWIWLNTFFL